MLSNTLLNLLAVRNNITNNANYLSLVTATLLLILLLANNVNAAPLDEKVYLRIEQSKALTNTDFKITSFGMLAFKKDVVGHLGLTRIKSGINGNTMTLDFGGGYVFNWDVSLYLSLGISLGYNTNSKDYLAAYYPEAGIVADITKTFGITANARRYHHLYKDNEDIVMFGVVFRN